MIHLKRKQEQQILKINSPEKCWNEGLQFSKLFCMIAIILFSSQDQNERKKWKNNTDCHTADNWFIA